ncbi:paREP2b [Pyrobaculum aerophilum str. IM2]|uniref:PaREP2b n=1 Tax=Pyrobaculum aerophilum (strain ATCC 51768 / DSM 7523 / JCM 9630 / CIP 104966 / NBRC 100827 / IM2) TaxID=178306 RepID=Q8ZWV7_PYRAE|nr:paREP2b [Pyrobaculum aerophilum str. IM2]
MRKLQRQGAPPTFWRSKAGEGGGVDPNDVVAKDAERRIKAVMRYVRVEWDGDRPRVVVEYEADGVAKSFTWSIRSRGRIQAHVRLNSERPLVLTTLTGDKLTREKKNMKVLATKHISLA